MSETGSADIELRNCESAGTVVNKNDFAINFDEKSISVLPRIAGSNVKNFDSPSSFTDVGKLDVEIASSSLNNDDSLRKIGSVGGKCLASIIFESGIHRGEVESVVCGIVERGRRLVRDRWFTEKRSAVSWEVGNIAGKIAAEALSFCHFMREVGRTLTHCQLQFLQS